MRLANAEQSRATHCRSSVCWLFQACFRLDCVPRQDGALHDEGRTTAPGTAPQARVPSSIFCSGNLSQNHVARWARFCKGPVGGNGTPMSAWISDGGYGGLSTKLVPLDLILIPTPFPELQPQLRSSQGKMKK